LPLFAFPARLYPQICFSAHRSDAGHGSAFSNAVMIFQWMQIPAGQGRQNYALRDTIRQQRAPRSQQNLTGHVRNSEDGRQARNRTPLHALRTVAIVAALRTLIDGAKAEDRLGGRDLRSTPTPHSRAYCDECRCPHDPRNAGHARGQAGDHHNSHCDGNQRRRYCNRSRLKPRKARGQPHGIDFSFFHNSMRSDWNCSRRRVRASPVRPRSQIPTILSADRSFQRCRQPPRP
jgi:hypothetical protein